MGLRDSYRVVKRSIVAFCPKYIAGKTAGGPPLFPPIIGTGFIVAESGIVCTNDHVVRAFKKAFRPPGLPDADWGVYALMLYMTEAGQLEIPLEVIGVGVVGEFKAGPAYYGPPKPDVAFVHVRARGLPALEISNEDHVVEGTELATAGYPMGTDALTAPGYVHQITPTLQRGIVSAVLPFECEKPHAFTINVMTQGGASGSPVFDPETGRVAGVLYAGLNDIGVTEAKDLYRVPTNISYVVPAHLLRIGFADFVKNAPPHEPDMQTIDEMVAKAQLVNILEKGRQWEVREIKMDRQVTDAVRLTEVKRTAG